MENRRSGRLDPSKNHLKGDSNGRFRKVIHLASGDDSSLVDLKTKKKTSLGHYNLLISENVITHGTNFICEKCMEKLNPSMQGTEFITEYEFSDNEIETSELASRSYSLGNEISKLIKSDVAQLHNITSKQQDAKGLVEHDPLRWLNQRPE